MTTETCCGTCGQDRDSYTDEQDRDDYTVTETQTHHHYGSYTHSHLARVLPSENAKGHVEDHSDLGEHDCSVYETQTDKYAGHTPGPWNADYNAPGHGWGKLIQGANGAAVAAAVELADGSGPANARLIADAPTLLAQRDALVAALEGMLDVTAAHVHTECCDHIMDQARAVLEEAWRGS